MPFELSEEVTVAINKNVETDSCEGVIIKSEGDSVQLALRGRGVLAKTGSMIHLQSHAHADLSAWGSLLCKAARADHDFQQSPASRG